MQMNNDIKNRLVSTQRKNTKMDYIEDIEENIEDIEENTNDEISDEEIPFGYKLLLNLLMRDDNIECKGCGHKVIYNAHRRSYICNKSLTQF